MAWRDAPGVFLYAASKASSSAVTSVPLSIPFSRSISRTASRISWLMYLSLPLVDEIRPHNLVVRDVDLALRSGGDGHRPLAGRDQLPTEARPAPDLGVRPQRDPPALGAREVRQRAQWGGRARR